MIYRFYYYPSPTLSNFCQWGVKNDGALCVQMDFTRTYQTKCNNINHVCSHFYNFFVILNYHRCLWANIFDTNIYRCINSYIKMVYWAFLGIFMLLQINVCVKTTKNLQKWIQTWFILLHTLVWNVRVKFTKKVY